MMDMCCNPPQGILAHIMLVTLGISHIELEPMTYQMHPR